MQTITWKIKDSWVETKRDHPGEYTDYLFLNGWVILSKLFDDVKSIYGFGGHAKGSCVYWHNFRPCSFDKAAWKTFFLRIDFGRGRL